MFSRSLALTAAAVLVTGAARATTIRVPGDQPTIQAGLDAAAPGDTVLVAPGTYVGAGNRNLDFTGKAIVLRSSAGAATTILDGQHVATLFNFHSGETAAAVVEAFTIRNGSDGTVYGGGASVIGSSPTFRSCVFSQNPGNLGGGLYCENASPVLAGCTFGGNSAANQGGGMYAINSSPALSGCAFTGNTAGFGAGFCLIGSSSTASLTECTFDANPSSNLGGGVYCSNAASLAFTRCTFTGNTARHGAGVHCLNAAATFDSSSFSSNSAQIRGGGIFFDGARALVLTGCTFSGNGTTLGGVSFVAGGGGLHCLNATSASLTRCRFLGNTGLGINGYGGGVFLRYVPSYSLAACVFADNSASNAGGGLSTITSSGSAADCSFSRNSAPTAGAAHLSIGSHAFTRCTFDANHADHGGATVCGGVPFTDCIFSGNTAIQEGGAIVGPARLTGSILHGNSATWGGAVAVINAGASVAAIADCVLYRNSAVFGGAFDFLNSQGSISGSTVAFNSGSFGGGVSLRDSSSVTLDNIIIGFGTSGEAVSCEDAGSVPVLACSDIFGNAGGDWTACIEDQLGINGCFAADPRFCAPALDDFTLAETSPCAPAHSPAGCGLIGALPVGCVTPIGVPGAEAPAAATGLRVKPIPVRSDGIIEWTSALTAAVVRLYDPAGRLVTARSAASAGRLRWSELVGGRRLPAGVYFLELAGAGTVPVVVLR